MFAANRIALFLALCMGVATLSCVAQSSDNGKRSTQPPPIRLSALWDGRKSVDFHSVQFPRMVRASDAHFLIDPEYVLGITENGESRAYPTRFVSWHHIVNDRIGKPGNFSFVTITYCIVCNSGILFETPVVNNRPLSFDFYGLYNGVMALFDTSTNSVWLQITGSAVKGPLTGRSMKTAPLLDTTWGEWKRLHPDTLVMAPDAHVKEDYEPRGSIMVRGYDSFPAAYFKPTITHKDSRLPMFEPVLAVSLPESGAAAGAAPTSILHRAYPLKAFGGKTSAVNDVLGNEPIAVLFRAGSETASAVSRVIDGQTLNLEVRKNRLGKADYYDRETGSRWTIEGRAVDGPLAGKSLARIDSHMSQWYGWVSYFPDTSIFGRDREAPQPSIAASARIVAK